MRKRIMRTVIDVAFGYDLENEAQLYLRRCKTQTDVA